MKINPIGIIIFAVLDYAVCINLARNIKCYLTINENGCKNRRPIFILKLFVLSLIPTQNVEISFSN